MSARAVRIGWALAAVVLSRAALAEPEPPLRFNPFAAPDLARLSTSAPAPAGGPEVWEPVLRATLRAVDGSLADLGGVLLAEGESHRGWTLLEVGEFEATFELHGERVVLPVARRSDEGATR